MTQKELARILDGQLRQEFPLFTRNPHGAELCGELARRLAKAVKMASIQPTDLYEAIGLLNTVYKHLRKQGSSYADDCERAMRLLLVWREKA